MIQFMCTAQRKIPVVLHFVELLNLWNDSREVVRFIDENPWVKPLLARIQSDKNRGGK